MNYSKTANAPMTSGSMTNGVMTNGRMGMGNRDQVTHWQGTQNWDDIDRAVALAISALADETSDLLSALQSVYAGRRSADQLFKFSLGGSRELIILMNPPTPPLIVGEPQRGTPRPWR